VVVQPKRQYRLVAWRSVIWHPFRKEQPVLDFSFEVDDLELDDLAVTTMRDAVALPESGASNVGSSCSCSSSSCCCCQVEK
jgi:thiazolylpeptide-type bacteriocin precursor